VALVLAAFAPTTVTCLADTVAKKLQLSAGFDVFASTPDTSPFMNEPRSRAHRNERNVATVNRYIKSTPSAGGKLMQLCSNNTCESEVTGPVGTKLQLKKLGANELHKQRDLGHPVAYCAPKLT